jgi:hypothetical protein
MQKTLKNKIHHSYNPIYEVQEETPQQHFEGMATRMSAAVTLWASLTTGQSNYSNEKNKKTFIGVPPRLYQKK